MVLTSVLHCCFRLSLRTLHLQGIGRTDFSLWYSDIQRAAGGKGNTLREQQLSRNDIPIIVDSCIAFITQYGEDEEECGIDCSSLMWMVKLYSIDIPPLSLCA